MPTLLSTRRSAVLLLCLNANDAHVVLTSHLLPAAVATPLAVARRLAEDLAYYAAGTLRPSRRRRRRRRDRGAPITADVSARVQA